MTAEESIKIIRDNLGFGKDKLIMPYSNEMDAFGMAIEALQKQIPTEPIHDFTGFVTCRRCHKVIRNKQDFCHGCGQKILWED